MPGAEFFLNAWYALTSDRPLGALGGCGEIPRRSIRQLADDYGLDDPDDFDQLVRMIRAMDKVYLDWVKVQQEQSRTKKPDGN